VGLEQGPLSLVSTTEEQLEKKSSSSGLDIREYGCRDPLRLPRDTLYPQKLALTSPTSGGRSVGIVRSWTEARVFLLYIPNAHPLQQIFTHFFPRSLYLRESKVLRMLSI
jgi:hypothetical protein